MKRTTFRLALLGLTTACAAPSANRAAPPTETADWRVAPPVGGTPPPLAAPIPERHILPNGLTVLVVHRPGLPLVHTTILVRSGSAQDPPARPGLAGLLGELLRAGTTTRSAAQLADAIETLGGSLEISVDDDAMTIATSVMQNNHAAALALLSDVVQHPALAADEVERVRRERLAALTGALDDPGYVAWAACRAQVYGSHPYGHTPLGTAVAIERATPGELRAYLTAHLRPANAAVIVVGSLTAAEAVAAVRGQFEPWRGLDGPPALVPAPAHRDAGVLVVDKSEAPQSRLCIAHLGVARRHPDYLRLVVANAILGGSFSSRINMNLREDKGYTYGARSQFEMLRAGGSFQVSTAVETTVTAAAIHEVVKEVVTVREADVTRGELTTAKNRYSLSLPGYFQTVRAIAGMIGNIYLHELPLDYYQTLPQAVEAITLADVRRVAQEHLQPASLSIVVVGDQDRVTADLEALGRGPVHHQQPSPTKSSAEPR